MVWEIKPCRQGPLSFPTSLPTSSQDGHQAPSPAGTFVPSLVTFQPKTSLCLLTKVRLYLGAFASPKRPGLMATTPAQGEQPKVPPPHPSLLV